MHLICTYNSTFAFTLPGVEADRSINTGDGPYVFVSVERCTIVSAVVYLRVGKIPVLPSFIFIESYTKKTLHTTCVTTTTWERMIGRSNLLTGVLFLINWCT